MLSDFENRFLKEFLMNLTLKFAGSSLATSDLSLSTSNPKIVQ